MPRSTTSVSDNNGRALEYMLVEALQRRFSVQLTPRAQQDQLRDASRPSNLTYIVRERLEQSVKKIVPWVSSKIDTRGSLIIDRLPDQQGCQGDVTDICISKDRCNLNLSLKNNHYALKHQRPRTLCTQMGFPKDGREDNSYKQAYRQVLDGFLSAARELSSTAINFSDLEAAQPGFIKQKLYLPVCSLIHCTYLQHGETTSCAEALFRFLVGNVGFYKIVVPGESVEVFDFQNICLPTSFQSSFDQSLPNYVKLSFNNNWLLSLRLHTASSRISRSVSLKFDTQIAGSLPVTKEVL